MKKFARVILNPKKERSLMLYHPWIFSGAVGKTEGEPEEGDIVEISIWEAPPATLFNAGAMSSTSVSNSAGRIVLPEQMINSEGNL